MTKRFRITQIVAMLLVVGFLSTASLQAATNVPRMIPDNFSTLAEQVGPAVVNIWSRRRPRTGKARVSFKATPSG